MTKFFMLGKLILPATYVIGGFLAGLLFEFIILKKVRQIAARTAWQGEEILVGSLRGVTILWFTAAGIYAAIRAGEISHAQLGIVHEALLVIIALSVTVVVARISSAFVSLYSRRVGGVLMSTSMFANLTRIIVFIIGALIILQTLGISIAPVLTALGVGGLAVALALQDTLSNLFAGIHVIASRQVEPGDYIKLSSGEEGYVRDITWRYTTIQELPNNMIIIPNSKLASSIVTNYYYPEKEMSVLVQVGVGYGSDLGAVEKETIEVAREVMREVSGGVARFDPFVRYHTFGDSSVNFTVILRGMEFTDQYLLKHEFVKRLHKRYRERGIEIPFPIRTVYLRKESGL
jgi:small-conductance mechanosensitive channel